MGFDTCWDLWACLMVRLRNSRLAFTTNHRRITMKKNNWYKEYYKQFLGYKIISFKLDGQGEQFGCKPFPTFIIQKGKEKIKLTVSCDPEGNDAGFLHSQLLEDK